MLCRRQKILLKNQIWYIRRNSMNLNVMKNKKAVFWTRFFEANYHPKPKTFKYVDCLYHKIKVFSEESRKFQNLY